MKGKKLTHKERVEKLEADSNERRRICRELCAHLAEGYSLESFSEISTNSLRKYINLYKEEFPQEEIDLAMQKGRDMWESIGRRQAMGDCLGNSRTWFYNMAHRYKWSDRVNVETEHKGNVNVNVVSYAASKKPLQCNEKSE